MQFFFSYCAGVLASNTNTEHTGIRCDKAYYRDIAVSELENMNKRGGVANYKPEDFYKYIDDDNYSISAFGVRNRVFKKELCKEAKEIKIGTMFARYAQCLYESTESTKNYECFDYNKENYWKLSKKYSNI
jgi:hypothetical protein